MSWYRPRSRIVRELTAARSGCGIGEPWPPLAVRPSAAITAYASSSITRDRAALATIWGSVASSVPTRRRLATSRLNSARSRSLCSAVPFGSDGGGKPSQSPPEAAALRVFRAVFGFGPRLAGTELPFFGH